jgi:Raf kinase inhibitor-like YbhB/YbcL family protein
MYSLFILAITLIAAPLKITSPAFSDNGMIPDKYTCKGENINPEIDIQDIPKDAKTLVLIVDDPDAPDRTFDHSMVWNIPVTNKITEDSVPGHEGKNSKKEYKYTGPCPPSGTHHYHFKVFALNKELDVPRDIDRTELLNAMEPHIVAKGELVGLYKK